MKEKEEINIVENRIEQNKKKAKGNKNNKGYKKITKRSIQQKGHCKNCKINNKHCKMYMENMLEKRQNV